LQNQVKTMEKNVRSEINKGFEQIRASDKHKIHQFKSSLDEMHKNVQTSRVKAIKQSELVKQLQAKVLQGKKYLWPRVNHNRQV
jgi:hypothetical protein